MPTKKKLSVGPLPPEKDDYTDYEEVDILWGRIAFIAIVFTFAVGGLGYFAINGPVGQTTVAKSAIEVDAIEAQSNPDSAQDIETASEPREATQQEQREPVVASVELQRTRLENTSIEAAVNEPLAFEVKKTEPASSSVITTLHTGIQSAVLSSAVDAARQPVDVLGYDVPLNEEGLIKVVLHTNLQGLQGKTLYHEWELNEQTQAKVKIPVRRNEQISYSSKYIDRYMTGDWTVKVRDEQGEIYVLAQFRVQDL